MAISRSARQAAIEQRAEIVLDCAQRLFQAITKRSTLSPRLVDEVSEHVQQSLPLAPSATLALKIPAFDDLGTQLWNLSIGSLYDDQSPGTEAPVARPVYLPALVRLFALQLIETSSRLQRPSGANHSIRVLRTALKTAQICLDRGCLDLALKALEVSSEQVEDVLQTEPLIQISNENENLIEQKKLRAALVMQYFLLRVFHAFKIDRLDLADHFFGKIELNGQQVSLRLREQAADLFYEVARSLAVHQKPDIALIWFERALTTLAALQPEDTSVEIAELNISVMISYAEVLIDLNTDENRKRCQEILHQLDLRYTSGGRMAIDVTRLKLLITESLCDHDAIHETLVRICKLPAMTERNFRLIMQSMRKASQIAPAQTLSALKVLVSHRLLPDMQADANTQPLLQAWLEKTTVAFILFATSVSAEVSAVHDADIQNLLDTIQEHNNVPFSAPATHASQALIWKAIEMCDDKSISSLQKTMRHPLFDNAGHLNKGRIGRRTMAHALDHGDVHLARQVFFQLPVTVRNEASTRYLAFKAALMGNDQGLAEESIEMISQYAAKDPTYLYACVLDAQQSDMRPIAIVALQAILDKKPPGTHLSSILRCTARLLTAEMEAAQHGIADVSHAILEIFESASRSKEFIRQATPTHWLDEMQWWSKNAYNMALQACTDVDPGTLIRLLAVCRSFLDHCSDSTNVEQTDDISLRKMTCSFLSATAFMVLGRAGVDGSGRESYGRARSHISAFILLYPSRSQGVRRDGPNGLQQRAFQLLKFDVECILKLGQWSEMRKALESCLNFEEATRWDSLVDLLIIAKDEIGKFVPASDSVILDLLQRAINATWKEDKDIAKLARWVRIAFTLSLDDERIPFGLLLARQAAGMAEGGQKERHDRYPPAELHWLASICFNRAVDFLGRCQDDDARSWMDAALEIARWAADNGSLHALLTARRNIAQQRMDQRQP